MFKNTLNNQKTNKQEKNKKKSLVSSNQNIQKKMDDHLSLNKTKFSIAILFFVMSIASFFVLPVFPKIASFKYFELLKYGIPVLGVLFGCIFLLSDPFVIKSLKKFVQYIQDATKELNKVVWPERKSAITITITVIIFVAILALFIWLSDSLIHWIFYDLLLNRKG